MTSQQVMGRPLVAPPPDPVPRRVRAAALVLALYVAGVHVALAESRYSSDARYVGALFVLGALALTIGAAIATGGRRFSPPLVKLAWVVDAGIAVAMFTGFVLSRTTGLPGYHRHDVPVVQVIALVAEAAYVATFVLAWRRLPSGGSGDE